VIRRQPKRWQVPIEVKNNQVKNTLELDEAYVSGTLQKKFTHQDNMEIID